MKSFQLDDQLRKPLPSQPQPKPGGEEGGGPSAPKVNKPDTKRLLDRMKRVDPEQARRYRQRSGE